MTRVFDPGAKQSLRSFGKAQRPQRLFDDQTPERQQRRKMQGVLLVTLLAWVAAILIRLFAPPSGQILSAIPGLFGTAGVLVGIFGQLSAGPPTITCAGCGAVGWVEDIKAFGGRCPHCRSTMFHADGRRQGTEGQGEMDFSGDDLCSGAIWIAGDMDSKPKFSVPRDDGGGDNGGGDSGGDDGGGDSGGDSGGDGGGGGDGGD